VYETKSKGKAWQALQYDLSEGQGSHLQCTSLSSKPDTNSIVPSSELQGVLEQEGNVFEISEANVHPADDAAAQTRTDDDESSKVCTSNSVSL
jgi:hypothetical protein